MRSMPDFPSLPYNRFWRSVVDAYVEEAGVSQSDWRVEERTSRLKCHLLWLVLGELYAARLARAQQNIFRANEAVVGARLGEHVVVLSSNIWYWLQEGGRRPRGLGQGMEAKTASIIYSSGKYRV